MLSVFPSSLLVAGNIVVLALFTACSDKQPSTTEPDITEVRNKEHDNQLERGSYLVTAGHCYDCHTPI